jgi:hypothetical protein
VTAYPGTIHVQPIARSGQLVVPAIKDQNILGLEPGSLKPLGYRIGDLWLSRATGGDTIHLQEDTLVGIKEQFPDSQNIGAFGQGADPSIQHLIHDIGIRSTVHKDPTVTYQNDTTSRD